MKNKQFALPKQVLFLQKGDFHAFVIIFRCEIGIVR